MANPAKVLNFFDLAGSWDPSLAFVMGGGLAVALVGYRLLFARRKAPVFEAEFALPSQRRVDRELIGGAACSASAGESPASARAVQSRRSGSAIRKRRSSSPR